LCTALRLARFNTMSLSKDEDRQFVNFFVGIPAPAGALLALLPVIYEFELKDIYEISFKTHPYLVGIYQSIIALFMASRIPTFSPKIITIEPKNMGFVLIFASVVTIFVFLSTWVALPIVAILYLCSIPYSYIQWKKVARSL
ncbi:MAG: CDP-diacylglycerol--serine O-phosphatidyltransferase, partial [Rickettsiaceae bacterium]|nr:CDP-diacylglycerol--serine O-phosphatidyltransferase [Rickettsiaceae bacterium]